MDFGESDEHQLLRAAVRDIAAGFGHDYFLRRSQEDQKTAELWQAIANHGFLAVHLPERYGGGGAGMQELAIVCEETAAQGCPLLLMVVSAAICAELISRLGTEAQKSEWLPGLVTGEKMAFAITEPDAGSNSHRISTVARRDGDVYRINGTKTFISGVDESSRLLVVSRTSVDPDGGARLTLLIVDTNTPGLERSLIPVGISAPEKQFMLHFDDVVVPVTNRLGDENDGLRLVFFGLNPERIMSAALAAGIGRYALDKASSYARDRSVWGVPIGQHQGIAHPLAGVKVALELARLMTAKAAWLQDHDAESVAAAEAANMAKYAAAEAGLACLDEAIQTHGGNGMAVDYGLVDLWGLARLLRIAPVSREMILNFVSQHSLGLPRSY
ncbi:MAG: acyl-CoA/acyl-ACP dehydrogenase [Acidimicrobiaceae bacterium]|nr:acyl-CoA/acyl-ACP dehydrogenase [Acidimicrobiaceae bacterium]MBO0747511.1 acyl-CoA/acyl-ACP dehydrogenase [Acidimicrobiaceae bacterium]